MADPFKLFRSQCKDSDVSDEILVQRITQGDDDAWALFQQRYADLIFNKAKQYAESAREWGSEEDGEDEINDLYLFMAKQVRHSLSKFKGKSQVRTWVVAVLKNRSHVLKAYLLEKDPSRADVRLPKVLQQSPEDDKAIYRRLVWGLAPALVALELDLPEARAFAVLDLLKEKSPRVYQRIQANMSARLLPKRLDIDPDEDDDTPRLEVISNDVDLADRELLTLLQEALSESIQQLATADRRILILFYQRQLSAAEILELAQSEAILELDDVKDINRLYYLRNRALQQVESELLSKFAGMEGAIPQDEKALRQHIEELLYWQGVSHERL